MHKRRYKGFDYTGHPDLPPQATPPVEEAPSLEPDYGPMAEPEPEEEESVVEEEVEEEPVSGAADSGSETAL